ncbi:MAG: ATP synthase F0 subunit B [Patescibacteria group bacterium]
MENLGLNLQSFIINTLVFGVFFVLMHFLVLKKIGAVITKREAKLMEADKRSEETKHALEKAKEEFAKIIENAKEESHKIVNDSKHQANDQAKKILEKAQIDAGEIIVKAQGVLTVEKEKMLADFRENLEKSVKESLTIILSSQADKIDFDAKVLEEVTVKS